MYKVLSVQCDYCKTETTEVSIKHNLHHWKDTVISLLFNNSVNPCVWQPIVMHRLSSCYFEVSYVGDPSNIFIHSGDKEMGYSSSCIFLSITDHMDDKCGIGYVGTVYGDTLMLIVWAFSALLL